MKLVWNSSQYKITYNDLEIELKTANTPYHSIDAIVEEQDTGLVLEPSDIISNYGDNKPLWYLANTRELQVSHLPGTIVIKTGQPIKLQAIVHDLDFCPSWKKNWIRMALIQTLNICNKEHLNSIALPVLGTQFGKFSLEEFIILLAEILTTQRCNFPVKISLIMEAAHHQKAFNLLQARLLKQ